MSPMEPHHPKTGSKIAMAHSGLQGHGKAAGLVCRNTRLQAETSNLFMDSFYIINLVSETINLITDNQTTLNPITPKSGMSQSRNLHEIFIDAPTKTTYRKEIMLNEISDCKQKQSYRCLLPYIVLPSWIQKTGTLL